ncbi:MAG: aminoglycoside phosphotransferase family protein [Anaerolineae bacterium]|nr:aminoglycoside phosphotransferase family protein [Anaerolineae bacterium]NUQ02939.1 aminoglycoside phosphotransferase family protein [Anaerolineae bacterium]
MLEQPDLAEVVIADFLRDAYDVPVSALTFLPLGADRNTAVYRADAASGARYFVKLRRGAFDETSVLVPTRLHKQGVTAIIAPIPTTAGRLYADLGEFRVILSPFIDGRDGWQVDLSDRQWTEFGRALRSIHAAALPAEVLMQIGRERYASEWRDQVRRFLVRAAAESFADPVSAELAALLRGRHAEIARLIACAEALGSALSRRALPFILCHADIHVGNLLIAPEGTVYMVDWDTLMLAPRERDLMFIGGGLNGAKSDADREMRCFYEGYGAVQIDTAALAYYRCERIVQDVAAYCEQILLTAGDSADRPEGLRQLRSQFEPGAVVEYAFRAASAAGCGG